MTGTFVSLYPVLLWIRTFVLCTEYVKLMKVQDVLSVLSSSKLLNRCQVGVGGAKKVK
jgi:hypothetical protein